MLGGVRLAGVIELRPSGRQQVLDLYIGDEAFLSPSWRDPSPRVTRTSDLPILMCYKCNDLLVDVQPGALDTTRKPGGMRGPGAHGGEPC